jgi:maltose O-acetyltransferase
MKRIRAAIGRQLKRLGRRLFPDPESTLDLRNAMFRERLRKVGSPVRIREPIAIHPIENVSIGSNVVIHENSYLQAAGGISIGDNVAISLGCTILTSGHLFDGEGWDALPWSNTNVEAPVSIEDNVWIGFNVIILPGVTIHEGAVVGAGSVVTRDVPKCAVVAGNPAEIIKYRDINTYHALKESRAFRTIPTDIDREYLLTHGH